MGAMVWEDLRKGNLELPVVVSFFTDAFYLREAFELARSCQRFQLDYSIQEVSNQQSWIKNTNFKPSFLLSLHERFANRALLWLDADARVRNFPAHFVGLKVPIAYHLWKGWQPQSGTVYLAPGKKRRGILEAWIEEVRKDPTATDQICMGRAVSRLGVECLNLPVDYCWIYDLSLHAEGKVVGPSASPVIEHMQASRWAKKLPAGGGVS